MKCPHCNVDNNEVYAAEPFYNAKHKDYKRYRKCFNCGKSFTTHERLREMVIKGDCTRCSHYQHWKDGVYNCVKWVCKPKYLKEVKTNEVCSNDH